MALLEHEPRRPSRRLDDYYTPEELASAVVAYLPVGLAREWVIEPSCGGGAFVRALQARRCRVVGIDVDPAARGLEGADVARVGDFLQARNDVDAGWVVGNPPYGDAQAHVEHALNITRRYVVMLLRLAFLESIGRVAFWNGQGARLREVRVLARRPSFVGTNGTDSAAYGVFWWDKLHTGPAAIVPGWRWS